MKSKLPYFITVGFLSLVVGYVFGRYVPSHSLPQTSPSADKVADDARFDKLKHLTTSQFLALIKSSTPQEQVALYRAHYRLSEQVTLAINDHLVGGDHVLAAQAALPYLMNKEGWNPIPAGDMELWATLEFRLLTLPKVEGKITPSMVTVGGLTFSQQQIDEVMDELRHVP